MSDNRVNLFPHPRQNDPPDDFVGCFHVQKEGGAEYLLKM